MKIVRLVAIDDPLLRAAGDDVTVLEARYGLKPGSCVATLRDVLDQTQKLYERLPRPAPWLGYLVAKADGFVVGACGFTHAPNGDGEVEIAYFTFPPFERQGYGTATARAMIALSATSRSVVRVIAHTLPETNASARILQRVGMSFAGEINHPEDGKVWRWQKSLSPDDR